MEIWSIWVQEMGPWGCCHEGYQHGITNKHCYLTIMGYNE